MNLKALLVAFAGAIVALVFALEAYLQYLANGFGAILIAKLLICGVGAYYFWINATRIRKRDAGASSSNAT